MEPRQLQQAVALTMAELRKGRVRRLLDWGKLLYRWGVAFAGPGTDLLPLGCLLDWGKLLGKLLYRWAGIELGLPIDPE